jgi:glycine cleavage system H protein
MSLVPDNLRYRESHEWIDACQDAAPCGISDHAQAELTDIVFVELPKVGRVVKAGEQCAVVESVKAASDIYAPVAGEIVEINEVLQNDPGLVNRDPYLNGWMFKLKVANAAEVDALLTPEAYRGHIPPAAHTQMLPTQEPFRPIQSPEKSRSIIAIDPGEAVIPVDIATISHAYVMLLRRDADCAEDIAALAPDLIAQAQPRLFSGPFKAKFAVATADKGIGDFPDCTVVPAALEALGAPPSASILVHMAVVGTDVGSGQAKMLLGFCFSEQNPRVIITEGDICVPA